jgi:hypothetical protein
MYDKNLIYYPTALINNNKSFGDFYFRMGDK